MPTLNLRGKLVAPVDDEKLAAELREWIPYEYILDWFAQRETKVGIENRVLILKAETASGKSTFLPPVIYEKFVHQRKVKTGGLICTQPRVLTAIQNVEEILKYNKWLVKGKNIGWSTQNNKIKPKQFGFLSATVGTLTQQLRVMSDDEIMSRYKFILIDETHERDPQTDMTISMLKNFMDRNAGKVDCPFVALMSATFDPTSFLKYFGIERRTNFIWCGGEAAGFEERWDWAGGKLAKTYSLAAVDAVEHMFNNGAANDPPEKADILIFMPGAGEIELTLPGLHKLNEKLVARGIKPYSIAKIDGDGVKEENDDFKRAIMIPSTKQIVTINGKKHVAGRRLILATVVAETGLTLPNLKYVADCGYSREIEFNPTYELRALITKPAPKSRINQRRGRAGRHFPGVFYPLYTFETYKKLQDIQYPTILTNDVTPVILDIIIEQIKAKRLAGQRNAMFREEDIDMIDVPTRDSLTSALNKMYTLGFVSPIAPKFTTLAELADGKSGERENGFSITRLGALFNVHFSMIDAEVARSVMAAYVWGNSPADMITIGVYSMLTAGASIKEKGVIDPVVWEKIYAAGLRNIEFAVKDWHVVKMMIADDFIDGLILFNAMKRIFEKDGVGRARKKLKEWCEEVKISYKFALSFLMKREDFIEQLLASGFSVFAAENNSLAAADYSSLINIVTMIKHCIYDGWRNNLLIQRDGVFTTSRGLVVKKPNLFTELELNKKYEDVRPAVMVFRSVDVKMDQKKNNYYKTPVKCVSVMDGFVATDLSFNE